MTPIEIKALEEVKKILNEVGFYSACTPVRKQLQSDNADARTVKAVDDLITVCADDNRKLITNAKGWIDMLLEPPAINV